MTVTSLSLSFAIKPCESCPSSEDVDFDPGLAVEDLLVETTSPFEVCPSLSWEEVP